MLRTNTSIENIESAMEMLRDRIRERMNEARVSAGDFSIYGKDEDKRRMKAAMIEAGKAIELHDMLESQIEEAAKNAAQVIQTLRPKVEIIEAQA
jgi:hypothetical protein